MKNIAKNNFNKKQTIIKNNKEIIFNKIPNKKKGI
jgi:hypothetical protein